MLCRSVIVLAASLSLAVGFTLRAEVTRTRRNAPYRGPPAPLNQDGTVAFTSEFHQANDVHNAAYVEEYQRLQAAAALALAHPDRTSPPSKDYNPQDNGQYNSHDNGKIAPQEEDDGQYRPHLYESNQQYSSPVQSHKPQVPYNQGSTQQYQSPSIYKIDPYTPTAHQKQQEYNPQNTQAPVPAPLSTATYKIDPYTPTTQHNKHQYNPSPQNPQAHIPAPLNPDGTVAQTPEYKALAASLHNSYQQALTRHRRSLNHYNGPPAPLNHDGTVANTPEIEQAIAIHKAAYAKQYQKLHEAEMLAAAHPDLSSKDYEAHSDNGYSQQYESHQDGGMYIDQLYNTGYYNTNENHQDNTMHYYQASSKYNPEAHIPAPLNHDGTVAHTAEYKAIAASHQAEYQKVLKNMKYHTMAPQYQHGSAISNNYW